LHVIYNYYKLHAILQVDFSLTNVNKNTVTNVSQRLIMGPYCVKCYQLFLILDMTPKRGLITDTFKVVKKAKRGGKRNKSPSPPKAGRTVCFIVCMCILFT